MKMTFGHPKFRCVSYPFCPVHHTLLTLHITAFLHIVTLPPCAGQSCYPTHRGRVEMRWVKGLRCASRQVIHIQND